MTNVLKKNLSLKRNLILIKQGGSIMKITFSRKWNKRTIRNLVKENCYGLDKSKILYLNTLPPPLKNTMQKGTFD